MDKFVKIIGLTGYKGSGKSTVAEILCDDFGFERFGFADPLKQMMRQLGLNDEQLNGNLKEIPCDLLSGNTPRFAMQTLGTEWGRDCLDYDFWVNLWKYRIEKSKTGHVVVDDCRFENEIQAIRNLNGTIINVIRTDIKPTDKHISENSFENQHDFIIDNTKSIDTLVFTTHALMEHCECHL